MSSQLRAKAPRIIVISQWPNVKNGEYEIIEKIKQTGFEIEVVDFLGFSVDKGELVNDAEVHERFDFAVSLHYDTPKFLNLPTFLWVSNPLEFMLMRHDYPTVILSNLRSYDGYLFNGSETLQDHIQLVLNDDDIDRNLMMFPACSINALKPPSDSKKTGETAKRLFYCGVNWERATDSKGRAHGLLETLQDLDIADFYGPNKLLETNPWQDFHAYKGEIPFDGVSLVEKMQNYGAVLAVSSPAHIKSQTSSSRVFEGISAGTPVISDRNPHTIRLFGDSVYYFDGDSDVERAASIQACLSAIMQNPGEARAKVLSAQKLMAEKYCFEPCFEKISQKIALRESNKSEKPDSSVLTIFVLNSTRDGVFPNEEKVAGSPSNAGHISSAASFASTHAGVRVEIIYAESLPLDNVPTAGITYRELLLDSEQGFSWSTMPLGAKVQHLSSQCTSDFVVFFDENDFPNYDFFTTAINWFESSPEARKNALYVSGFYEGDLSEVAPNSVSGVLRNNETESAYRWSQQSLSEHQLGALVLPKNYRTVVLNEKVKRLDILLPISLIISAYENGFAVHRNRHFNLRVKMSRFNQHLKLLTRLQANGFWAQHYQGSPNYQHELNHLYDLHQGKNELTEIIWPVQGIGISQPHPVDPAVHAVNAFVNRLRPFYRFGKRLRNLFRIKN